MNTINELKEIRQLLKDALDKLAPSSKNLMKTFEAIQEASDWITDEIGDFTEVD